MPSKDEKDEIREKILECAMNILIEKGEALEVNFSPLD